MMSLAASPAGAEAVAGGVDIDAAARLVDLDPFELRRWQVALHERGVELGPMLGAADLVALAALATASRALGIGAGAYAGGLASLFPLLRARSHIAQLDSHAALIGRHAARLEARDETGRCARENVLIVPLRPILTGFRDLVFA